MNDSILIPSKIKEKIQHFSNLLTQSFPYDIINIYVTGSLAAGDFYYNKSDIDLIILVKEEFSEQKIERLMKFHKEMGKKIKRPYLNGFYFTKENLNRSSRIAQIYFEEKTLRQNEKLNLLETTLFELKNNSIPILKKEELDFEITIEDVHKNSSDNINSYWEKWIREYETNLSKSVALICIPRLTEWGVLGVARMLYTLIENKIVSKLTAGKYCLENLPKEYHPILYDAINIRKIDKTEFKPSVKRKRDTINCMKYILEKFNSVYNEKYSKLT